ncbi:TIR domain-containing protein [Terrimonas alba]|uniref:TIR domain-containing protein n=1 Tax=Terrimonas alba TaxID=3349636 RepID=UPI0035F22539
MADIFISYSSEDKTNVKLIAELLERHGWSVWWDRDIPHGRPFDTVIEEELTAAFCVIVIWTKRSVASEWVKNEANEALQAGKLVPILLENVPLPLAFKRTEAALLMDWKGELDHHELPLLFNSIEQTIQKNKTKKGVSGDKPKASEWKLNEKLINPSAARGYIAIAVIGFIVSLFAIYYYLNFIQGKVNDQADQRVFYLILIIFGIAASAVIFGVMNSYATLRGEQFNTKFKLAGPIVGVVLTVFGGFYLPHREAVKTITIRVFDKNKNPVMQGDVKVYLKEYIRNQSIDKMGQALFTGIPAGASESKIKIEVSSPGYATRQFDTVMNRSGVIELTLPLTAVVFISGQVKRANETPISDVEINVDGTRYVAHSISNGTYTLRLEEYTLGDEITITTTHEGFEDKTRAIRINSPEIRDVDFVLNPINH